MEAHTRRADRIADELDSSSFERGFDSFKGTAAGGGDAISLFEPTHSRPADTTYQGQLFRRQF